METDGITDIRDHIVPSLFRKAFMNHYNDDPMCVQLGEIQ
jgi:hypothetical protein